MIISKKVQDNFQIRGIDCVLADNAEDAYQILQKDKLNEITALICDYRLLKKNGDWQDAQGYHILEKVFTNFPNLLSFFALTSFNRKALLKIQQQHQMQVWSYTKDDVMSSEGGFNIFAEKVTEEAQKTFEAVTNIPKSKVWTKGYDKKFDQPFVYYYRLHRLSDDFRNANDNIGKEAQAFVIEMAQLKYNSKYEVKLPHPIEIYTFQEGIGKDKQMTTVKEKLEKFRFKLMGRRIAIALYHLLELHKSQVYWAMKTGFFGRAEDNNNTVNQFFTTYLGLSLEKDVPGRLLPEERNWLKKLESDSLLKETYESE